MVREDSTPRGSNAYLLLPLSSEAPIIPSSFVDVRDVGAAHVQALEAVMDRQCASVILYGKPSTWADIVSIVKMVYPGYPVSLSGGSEAPFRPETRRAEQLLGIK